MKRWAWRRNRPGVCGVCEGSDVAGVGVMYHASWCTERGGDGQKPKRAMPVLSPEEAARLRKLRSVERLES